MNFKPVKLDNPKLNRIIAWVIFAVALIVYVSTQARSLSFWDAGEYTTCSSILGIPHPPGNPFYIILGKFLTTIGIGVPHAIIVAFMSALMSAFAVFFTYLFTVKISTMIFKNQKLCMLSGVLAAVYTAFSFTFWMNAIEAEVYAGLALTINLAVWLTFLWLEKQKNYSHQHYLLLIVYVLFLGFGIHQTSLQIAPAVIFCVFFPIIKNNYQKNSFWVRFFIYLAVMLGIYFGFNSVGSSIGVPALEKYLLMVTGFGLMAWHLRGKVSKATWFLALGLIAIALSPHVFLYIRAAFRPFINEGHPSTPGLFADYILRRQYGDTSFMVRRASFAYQMKDQFLTYFSWQFFNADMLSNWFGISKDLVTRLSLFIISSLGIFGAVYQYIKNKSSFAFWFSFYFMSSIAMVFVINLSNAEVRDRDYFFVTAYNFWTVWLAIGSVALIAFFKKRNVKIMQYLSIAAVVFLPTFNLVSQYHVHDRSKEFIALDYGLNLMNGLEENAIIITNGDNDTFPIWYLQAVYDPYAKTPEKIEKYKNQAKLSDEYIKNLNKAIEFKTSTLTGIRPDITVANLSLLNTPWYIKQLRDKEGIKFQIIDKSDEDKILNANLDPLLKQAVFSFNKDHINAFAIKVKNEFGNALDADIKKLFASNKFAEVIKNNQSTREQVKEAKDALTKARNEFRKAVKTKLANEFSSFKTILANHVIVALNDYAIDSLELDVAVNGLLDESEVISWHRLVSGLKNKSNTAFNLLFGLLTNETKAMLDSFNINQDISYELRTNVLADINAKLKSDLGKLEEHFITNIVQRSGQKHILPMNIMNHKLYMQGKTRYKIHYNRYVLEKLFTGIISDKVKIQYDFNINGENQSLKAEFTSGQELQIKDLATMQLIKDNFGKRPIYFAVTTPTNVGFEKQLNNEGMVDKLVAKPNFYKVNEEKLLNNLEKVYSFRSIFDEGVYKDDNTKRLLNNYGSAYYRAFSVLDNQNKTKQAVPYILKAVDFIEDKSTLMPVAIDALLRTDNNEKAIELTNKQLELNPKNPNAKLQAGVLMIRLQKFDEGFELLKQTVQLVPNNEDLIATIYQICSDTKQIDRGVKLFDELLQQNPSFAKINIYRNKLLKLK